MEKFKMLIVDDEQDFLETIRQAAEGEKHRRHRGGKRL